ncbi:MAG: NCS2 family permease, partial [Propionibacteriaceae bacterium]|nr:NCS2 family permease [Propionibacteriaceae bacterium]
MTQPVQDVSISAFDRWFEITKRGSSVWREIRGGLVTFFTMAYIIVLNPIIIGAIPDRDGNLINGMPIAQEGAVAASMTAVATGTALIGGIMCILMGAWARFPLALATGLGLNSMLAYTIAPTMTWPQANGLIVWEGILITILVLTGFRKAVFNAVPRDMRAAISVGIGLFVAFVGLADAGVIRQGAGTPVELGIGGLLNGWPTGIFLIGLLLLVILHVKNVKGSILIAILSSAVLSIIVQAIFHIPAMKDDTGAVVNPTGWIQTVPELGHFDAPSFATMFRVDLFGAFTAGGAAWFTVIMLVFSLLLADFFDTMGTMVAVGAEGGLNDESGNPPHTQEILLVDSLGAIAGGVGGVSSNTS